MVDSKENCYLNLESNGVKECPDIHNCNLLIYVYLLSLNWKITKKINFLKFRGVFEFSLINNWFICQRAFIEIWSTWEVWRARKCVRVAWGVAESNSSFLSALQTSQVLHILMNAQLTYESIVLKHFQPKRKFFSWGICLLTSWVCTIGI